MGLISRVSSRTYRKKNYIMPASKKTLRNQQQKKNRQAGIGDAQGRIASSTKEANVMATCTVCRMQLRMIKNNKQAAVHVTSKHPGKAFGECFPGFTAG